MLDDLVPFVQFKKREKYPWSTVTFSKACNFTKSNSPPWVIFMGGSIKPLAEISFSTLQSKKCFGTTSFYTYFFVYYLAGKINFGPLSKGQPHKALITPFIVFDTKFTRGLAKCPAGFEEPSNSNATSSPTELLFLALLILFNSFLKRLFSWIIPFFFYFKPALRNVIKWSYQFKNLAANAARFLKCVWPF